MKLSIQILIVTLLVVFVLSRGIETYATEITSTDYYSATFNSGTVTELRPGSRVGGIVNLADPYGPRPFSKVGDDAKNRQVVGIFSFDTGPIPDNAVITHAEVSFPYDKKTYTSTLGYIYMDIKNRPFGQSEALEAEDFQSEATQSNIRLVAVKPVANSFYRHIGNKIPTDQHKILINKTGITQIRVHSQKRTNGNSTAEFYRITTGATLTAFDSPELKITYTY